MAGKPEVEKLVEMPVINPGTGRQSPLFWYAGKLDRRWGHRVDDWKSGKDPDRTILQIQLGFQGELYSLADEWAGGQPVHEVSYRIITTPSKRYTEPVFNYAVKRYGQKNAVRGGVCPDCETAEEIAHQYNDAHVERRVKSGWESREAFENACFTWLIDDPSRMRHYPHLLTQPRKEAARAWLWQSCKQIRACQRNRHWPLNPSSCYSYEKRCPYAMLCEAMVEGGDYEWLIEENYDVVEDAHPELDGFTHERQIVTYSSIRCFRECEMKYNWCYQRRLRLHQDDNEAIWIGSAMHAGLAAYAEMGLEMALSAIDGWASANPVLGEQAYWRQEGQVAKARSMVRAAATKWPDLEPPPPEPELQNVPLSEPKSGKDIPF